MNATHASTAFRCSVRGRMQRLFIAILMSAWAAGGAAQTVAPHVVAPEVPQVFGRPLPPPEGAAATPRQPGSPPPRHDGASAGLEVTLDAVVVDGAFDEMHPALDALWSRVRGQRLTLAQVQKAVDDYQHAYEAAGYLLARVVTPPQTLTDRGQLKLVVIDGFVESVETSGLPERLRNVVADRLAPVVGMRHLKAATVERQLMLLTNLPGVHLRSALSRGTERGGVRLIVAGNYDGTTTQLQLDNRLPRTLGTWETSLSMAANELFGLGEKLYAAAVTGAHSNGQGLPVASVIAGAVMPLGIDGFTANAEFTDSQSRQASDAGVPATQGSFQRVALRASDPWQLDRHHRIDLRASFERVQQSITATQFSTEINRDRYQVLRLGVEAGGLQAHSSYQSSVFLSRGLGGRNAAEAAATGIPLSRSGATPHFNKLDFSIDWDTEAAPGWELTLLAHGQFAGAQALLKSEQLSLEGGSDILSYPVGTFAVDSGAAARLELSRVVFPSQASRPWKLGVFVGLGRGRIAQPSAVEQASLSASSLGLSLRSVNVDELARWTPYFGLDCALRHSNDPNAPKGLGLVATIGAKL
jgi:hemolysin activation/secretion protein